MAGAVGTYYNGNTYQNPQARYGVYSGANQGGYYNTYGAGRTTVVQQPVVVETPRVAQPVVVKKSVANQPRTDSKKSGFVLGADFSHEFGRWGFEMKQAGSQLHYDNLSWNVISGNATYYFGDSTPMEIKVGARYGKQFGETTMIDDDISNGPYAYQDWDVGRQYGHAMSIGTSADGTQTGFNVAFGLTDFFSIGQVKITPSIGYRYFKHELETKHNYGMSIDTFSGNSSHPFINCISMGGETQCDSLVIFGFFNAAGQSVGYAVGGRLQDADGNIGDIEWSVSDIPNGTATITVDLGDTYYYEQAGVSHRYETEWAGPYVGFDMEYAINNRNSVDAGIEIGLPIYDSKGNQPYRIDWAHPTSVEDKGSFGDAMHIGLNSSWTTMITQSIGLSLGFTYDYYKVKGATANTFLNPEYYQEILDIYETQYDYYKSAIAGGATLSEAEQLLYEQLGAQVSALTSQKNAGWKIETKNEIDSIYKAMGIRAGINIKF